MKRHCKILLVDDDWDFALSLTEALRREGFRVVNAYDGVRAVEKAIKIRPDMILLDWRLPGGTGKWVYTTIQNCLETRSIPIIVLSAFEKPLHEQRFLHKPFEVGSLVEKMKTVLREKGLGV